ncbi:MAG: peptide-methionine (S)-S-oxide reductase, partial [Acidothermus sp.]|nr:peptide-methionine (S)-S-oxide reductase [Acidothermus sp.]
TQYRSVIFVADDDQRTLAEQVRADYDAALRRAGFPPVTTEIAPAGPFYYAEDYHQQYLWKNPAGYCGLKGTGVACPISL